ncbi:MAG: hypothetical protein WA913_10030 [Pricia sp.]
MADTTNTTDTTVAQINENTRKISRISWPAVFAGTITAIALMFLLNLLGLGVGLTSIDPMTESDPFSGIGTGTAIWWILSNLAALFTGGLVAARMSGYPSNLDGALHGFLTWSLYFIIGIFTLTSAIGGALNGIGNMLSGIVGGGDGEKTIVQIDEARKSGEEQAIASYDKIKQQMFDLVNSAEQYDVLPEDASEETREFMTETKQELDQINLENDIENFFNDLSFNLDQNGDLKIETEGSEDYFNKEEVKNYLTENTELSDEEIEGVVNKWEQRVENTVDKVEKYYAQTKAKVVEYSDKASDAAGTFSIVAFLILLLGAGAALFGGVSGSPDYKVLVDEERTQRRNTTTKVK